MADQLFIDTSGEVTPVAEADVAGAVRLGWVPASAQQAQDFALEQKFGGAAEGAKAFGEHAASAATLGLSDLAERAVGVDPAAMAAREKVHPVASGLGTAAGIAAPLLAGVPSAPTAIARLGEGTAGVVRAALPAGEGVVSRLAAKAAASGAGSAIEGAAYGAGQVVHESALGDPNLTAQSALSTIGLSAVLAGGLGGAGSFLGEALPEIMPHDLGAKVSDLLSKAEGHSNLNATNARPGEIRKVFTAKGEESATKIGLEARDLGIIRNPFTDSPDSIAERAGIVKTEQGTTLQRLVDEAAPDALRTTFDTVRAVLEPPILKALKSQGSTFAVGEQFEALLDRFGQAYEGRDLDLSGLWKLKQDIGDFIYKQGKVIDPWAKELNTPLKRVYDHLDQLVEDGIREGSGREAVAAWAQANRGFEVASTMERLAQKGIERSAENNAVHLTGQVGAMAGLVAGGAPGAVVLGIGSEAVRRRGSSALGWAARALRESIEPDAIEAVASKTAEAIAAERRAGLDTIAPPPNLAPLAKADAELKAALQRNGLKLNEFDEPVRNVAPASGTEYWRVHYGGPGSTPESVSKEMLDSANWKSDTISDFGATDSREGLSAMHAPDALHMYMANTGPSWDLPNSWLVRFTGEAAPVADFDAEAGAVLAHPKKIVSAEKVPQGFGQHGKGYTSYETPHESVRGEIERLVSARDDAREIAASSSPAASSPPEKVATLALLERLNQRATTRIETGMSAVLRGAPRAGRGEVEAGIARAFGKSPDDARSAFTKRTTQVRQLASDPQLMQSRLESQTDDWHDHAPNTAQALQITTARAVSFLASKLPAVGGAGPLAGKGAPSRSEMSKFNRYYEAIQNPLGVLKQAAAGTLTPEAIEALREVYPHLYEKMKATAIEKMGKASSIPYTQKLMLSMLLGQDLDGSLMSAARNFALYAMPRPQPLPNQKAGKMTLASRTLTPSQASAQRSR